jgi:flagellar basal-body rod protein FlgG
MLKAFFTSATGMRAQEQLIDNTAHNLANVNTQGFKKSHIEFSDLLYQTTKSPGGATGQGQIAPVGIQLGNGVRTVSTTKIFTAGAPIETGVDTHMAIEGEGFFKVTLQNGEVRYTRDGAFQRDGNGNMVSSDGHAVEPPIQIPIEALNLTISNQGVVSYINQNGVTTELGTIQLFRFANPAGLTSMGSNLYQANDASGPEIAGNPGQDGFGSIRQDSLEGSNVEVVTELVALITAQRAYEINSRAIRAGDEMLSNTSQLVR